MQSHPAAELFPMMAGADLDALIADIREHGQREPIIVHDGLILDGRNRFRACQQLGIEPDMVEWDRSGEPPEAFVISMNLHRRHLNESQRGLIAAKLANLKNGQRADLCKTQATGIPVASVSQPEAAKMLNISKDTVQQSRKVLDEATPEEVAAIERGEMTVNTVAKQIRQGRPPAKRKAKRDEPLAQTGRNPERIQRTQMHAEIWARMSDALIGLTSLPLPSDVVEIIAANTNRTRAVDDRLSRSLQWLKGFDDAWRNRG